MKCLRKKKKSISQVYDFLMSVMLFMVFKYNANLRPLICVGWYN